MSEPTAGRTGAACDGCGGTGMAPFGEPGDSCQACGGLGTVRGRTGEKGEAPIKDTHRHRFLADEDGVVCDCRCGQKYPPPERNQRKPTRHVRRAVPRAGALEIAEKALRDAMKVLDNPPGIGFGEMARRNTEAWKILFDARAALDEIARAKE